MLIYYFFLVSVIRLDFKSGPSQLPRENKEIHKKDTLIVSFFLNVAPTGIEPVFHA